MRIDKKRNSKRIFPPYQFTVIKKKINLKYLKFTYSEMGKLDFNEFP